MRPGVALAEEVCTAVESPGPDGRAKGLEIAGCQPFEDRRLRQQREGIRHEAIMAAYSRVRQVSETA
jgi:hypothetical protein